ncbi:ATP-dependent permease [Lecanora helva]
MDNEKAQESSAMESHTHWIEKREEHEEEENQVRDVSWLALLNFMQRSHAIIFVLAILLSVASGVMIPALAIFLGKVFDLFTTFGAGEISGSDLLRKVSKYGLELTGLGCASGALNAIFFGLWVFFGELQAKSVRAKLFDAMLTKDLDWYDMRKAGIETLISRQQTQIRELQLSTSQPIGFALQYIVTTLVALGLAFYYSWSLTFVTLATVPIAALFFAWISKQMEPSIAAQNEELTRASKIATNAISAIDTVKCFNGQDHERWQYTRSIRKAATHYLSEARANAVQVGFTRFITIGMFVQGFWFGSHLVNTDKKNPGEILTAFWACLMAMQSYEQIVPQIVILMKGRVAAATLKTMIVNMENGRTITKMVGRKSPSRCDGDVEVCNVSFAYPSRPEQPALKNTSFLFPAGETTFIVGTSGSGKSTLGNLLLRFYDAKTGDIFVDGHPLQTLDTTWLRDNVTLVQQQSVLFNETLFKNITFGRKDHSTIRRDEMKRSIETALLQHTIKEMPKGLDTLVGSGGSALSGGQKQRVAIARAHLRNTPILILDEATSALDHVSKSIVMENIRKWRNGKTTIIITHDMSQVEDGDFAYVMEEGAIVQQGYRGNLEKDDPGPFKKKPVSVIYPPSAMKSPTMDSAYHNESNFRERAVSSWVKATEDATHKRHKSRKSGLPTFLESLPELPKSPRSSRMTLPPVPPAAFPLHRSSYHSSIIDKDQQRGWQKSRIQDPNELAEQQFASLAEAVRHQGHISRDRTSTHSRQWSSFSEGLNATKRKRKTGDRYVAPIKDILATIWPRLSWRYRCVLLLGFVAATVHAAATPVFSFIFAKLLATFYLADRSQRSHQALVWSLSVLGIAGMDSAAAYSMHYLLEFCGRAWIDSLRAEAFKRILDQPRAWFDDDKNNLAGLTECLDRNAEEMRNLLGRFAGFVYVAAVMASMAIIWSMALSWKLTLVGLAAGPYIYAVTRAFESVSGRWENKSNEAGTSTNTIFTETFSNIRTVRALTLESHFHTKYTKAISSALTVGLKRSTYSGLFFGLSDSGVIFATALIFYYGAVLASHKTHSTNDIMTVFTMLLFSISNANAIIAFVPQINSSRATATRLLRLAHLPYKSSHEYTGHIRLSDPGTITLKNITFAYPTRRTHLILRSFSLHLPPGTTTALVGSSGSGKSTIASLLLALHPRLSGHITLQSQPLTTLHIPTLRSFIAIVPQTPTLFPATIRENIAYALPESSRLASLPSVRAAARAARIDAFVTSLPQGYETIIGPGGTGLSGGQAQRIAIARALVRRPKLLILDEATSGLDPETARGVRDTIKELKELGVGVLSITHDKEMMRVCGDVVVMKEGRIVEEGRFDEVRGQRGELWRLLGGEGGQVVVGG